jgi:hypothetical protein
LTSTAFITPSTFAMSRRRGDQRRMHAQFDARGRRAHARDAQQLDAVAQLLGVADVVLGEGRDALGVRRSNCIGTPKAMADMIVSLWAASMPWMSNVGSASA